MPAVPGKLSVDLTTYIQSENRLMAVKLSYEAAAAITDSNALKAVAVAFYTSFTALLAPLYSADVAFPCTVAGYYSDTATFDAVGALSAPIIGTCDGGGNPAFATTLPDSTSLLIQKRTGLGGRQNRGRIYLPACCEVLNKDGQYDDSEVAGSVPGAVASFMATDFTGGGATLHARLYSKKQNNLVPIKECRVMEFFGVRRKREPHGPNLPLAG